MVVVKLLIHCLFKVPTHCFIAYSFMGASVKYRHIHLCPTYHNTFSEEEHALSIVERWGNLVTPSRPSESPLLEPGGIVPWMLIPTFARSKQFGGAQLHFKILVHTYFWILLMLK